MKERRVKAGFYFGIELGKFQDFTALAIAEKEFIYPDARSEQRDTHYSVRHLERFQAGTAYPQMVERVASLMRTAPLNGDAKYAIDATGVALPVAQEFERLVRRACDSRRAIHILITNGDSASRDGAAYRVPRRDLASVLQSLLTFGRLRVAPALKDAGILTTELVKFNPKVLPAGQATDDLVWREGAQDDLVLAVALCCWMGEKVRYAGGASTYGI